MIECRKGYYCTLPKRSAEVDRCPGGRICLAGTDSMDELTDANPKGMILCPKGNYCPIGTETELTASQVGFV